MKTKLVAFEFLSTKERAKIRESIPLGIVEVSCPWWPTGHWERKLAGDPLEEAFYRIKTPPDHG